MRWPAITLLVLLLLAGYSCAFDEDDARDLLKILRDEVDDTNELWSAIQDSNRPKTLQHTQAASVSMGIKCKLRGKVSCSDNCLRGKRYFRDGCCQCKCKKNYAAISSTVCRRASWAPWGDWSKCIATSWGGLQTKERQCKSGGKEAPGACVGRGSIARMCSSVTKGYRIRKNVRNLTDEELHDLLQAMTKFKKDRSQMGYRNIISWHGYPGRCPWYRNIEGHHDHHCSWHHHPLFLPWHRLIVIQLELGLQRYLKNKTFGIPYWDWAEHATDVPYLIRHPQIYDPVLNTHVHNPFYRTFIRKDFGKPNLYSHRNIYYPRVLDDGYLRKGCVIALLSHDYYDFDERLSNNPHDQIHNCFCYENPEASHGDWCEYGMPTVTFASWDPLFLLHHSAIDRLFTMRKHLEESLNSSDWTQSRVVGEYRRAWQVRRSDIDESFEWPLSPFCNETMNSEYITRKNETWTLHKSYYGEQLFGYKYDNFDMGQNYTWEDLKRDFKNHREKSSSWNDSLFETKMGKLSESRICPAERTNTGGCVLSCS